MYYQFGDSAVEVVKEISWRIFEKTNSKQAKWAVLLETRQKQSNRICEKSSVRKVCCNIICNISNTHTHNAFTVTGREEVHTETQTDR